MKAVADMLDALAGEFTTEETVRYFVSRTAYLIKHAFKVEPGQPTGRDVVFSMLAGAVQDSESQRVTASWRTDRWCTERDAVLATGKRTITPVSQTRFGREGNCLAACVATILGVPLETVDMSAATDCEWFATLNAKLSPLGWHVLTCDATDTAALPPDAIHIRAGIGPRGGMHAVVYEGSTLVHDPHPDGGGINSTDYAVLLLPRWRKP